VNIIAECIVDIQDLVKEIIFSRGQVYGSYALEGKVSDKVYEIEMGTTYQGYVVDNVATRSIFSCGYRYCVFSKTFLEPATDRLVVLMDKVYGLCGHDVPPGMEDKVSEDAVWISDSFVMYPDKVSGEEVRMVLQSYELPFLNNVKGIEGAIAYNPTLATDKYLREALGFDGPVAATSSLVGFNYVCP